MLFWTEQAFEGSAHPQQRTNMFYCLLRAGVPPVNLHEPQIPEEPGQKQALPPYSLAMADLSFQVKRLQRAHAHLLQLHPRLMVGTESTINVSENA